MTLEMERFDPEDVTRVVVLFETADGMQHGWQVTDPAIKWAHAGLVAGSSHAEITVRGEFYRMRKDQQSREFEARMNQHQINRSQQ